MKTSNKKSTTVSVAAPVVAATTPSKAVFEFDADKEEGIIQPIEALEATVTAPVKAKKEKVEKPAKIDKRLLNRQKVLMTYQEIKAVLEGMPANKAQFLIDQELNRAPKLDSKSITAFILLKAGFGINRIVGYMTEVMEQSMHWSEVDRVKNTYSKELNLHSAAQTAEEQEAIKEAKEAAIA